MNYFCVVINKNHHSIRPTFLVCINYEWFTLNQHVLLLISWTESSLANLKLMLHGTIFKDDFLRNCCQFSLTCYTR